MQNSISVVLSISTIEIVLYEGTKLILTTALRYFSSLEGRLEGETYAYHRVLFLAIKEMLNIGLLPTRISRDAFT